MENFTLFSEHKAGLVKILAQNHQFLGVNNAIAVDARGARSRARARRRVLADAGQRARASRWCSSRRRSCGKLPGNWTFVVVTDRVELDDQIAKTFKATGAVSEAESDECHAASGAHLRELLRGNHRYVFTLIHKFQTPEMLCDRPDVIVLTDEAHRSQYDTLALNMRAALPKALFLAFTGTPLIAGEERTREVFGDYVSIYDFQQSVEDGATVPLFYENRTPELQLEIPTSTTTSTTLIEAAELDEEQESAARTGARPAVSPDHPRRPAGDGRQGHRPALPRPRVSGQGDGRVHRQGHRPADARQGAEALAGRARAGRDGACKRALTDRSSTRTQCASCKQRLRRPDHDRHGADRLARPERDRADEGSSASTSCRTASG